MGVEFDKLSQRLSKRGLQVAADKLQELKLTLQNQGMLPDYLPSVLPIPTKGSPKAWPIELAQEINSEVAGSLDDEVSFVTLSAWKEKYRQEIWGKPPQEWTEFMKKLNPPKRGLVTKIINSFAGSGSVPTIKELREGKSEELAKVRNMSLTSVGFAKAMFTKKDE